jgi:drug/metabolite transporter (DMT)-like permease
MKFSPVLSFIIILIGNFIGSLGMVLQKYSITGLTETGAKKPPGGKLKAIWLLGFGCINLVPLFQFLAVGGLGTQKMGAATGVNVVFMLFLSAALLKERVTVSASIWAWVMVGAIAAANLIPQAGATGFSLPFVLAAGLTPIAFLLPVPFFLKTSKSASIAALCGAASGAFTGFMVIPLKFVNSLLAGSSEYGLQGIFSSWIFWALLFSFSGAASLVLIQFAYAKGPMQASAPYFYGMAVIWPICWSYLVFAIPVAPIPALLFALVALSAIMIQRASAKDQSKPIRSVSP